MRITPIILSVLLTATVPASASLIFSAGAGNLNTISNAVTGTTSASFAGGSGTFDTTGLNNYNGGIASQQDIDTLLGRLLLDTETVILSLTVDGMTGDLQANGYEFGISPDGTGFRPAGHLVFQLRANGQTSKVSPGALVDGDSPATFNLGETSIEDGFSGTLTANAQGYTFDFTGVNVASGTGPTSFSGTFANATQFRNLFGSGHFYTTAQKNANPMTVTISTATIQVIPEPGTMGLLLLGAAGLARRLKRM